MAVASGEEAGEVAPPDRWWEAGDAACPEGVTLLGAPLPDGFEAIDPPENFDDIPSRLAYLLAFQVSCGSGEPHGEHGRKTAWYGNGQRASDREYVHGVMVSAVLRDEWGRVTDELRCSLPEGTVVDPAAKYLDRMAQVRAVARCEGVRRWWHAGGQLAIEGPTLRGPDFDCPTGSGCAHGVWTHWDEAGAVVGQVTFDRGIPGPMDVAASQLLVVADLDPGSAWLDLQAEAPRSSSVERAELGVLLRVDPQMLKSDGVQVLRWETGEHGIPQAPASFMAEERIEPLHADLVGKVAELEAINERMDPARTIPVAVMLDAPASFAYGPLHDVLFTAATAGMGMLQILVNNPGPQRAPNHGGPPRLQGRQTLNAIRVSVAATDIDLDAPAPAMVKTSPLVAIDGEGFRVVVASAGIDQRVPCKSGACELTESYELEGLRAVLRPLLEAGSVDTRAVIVPAPGVPLQTVVWTLDGLRRDPKIAEGQGPRPMFSEVVLGRASE